MTESVTRFVRLFTVEPSNGTSARLVYGIYQTRGLLGGAE